MNLDDEKKFARLDQQDMLGHILALPDQLQEAWELGQQLPLQDLGEVKQVLAAGMGGSAIGAALLAAYSAPSCIVPITILRDYQLPAWAQGPDTLIIASSHSGNTEETLSVAQSAVDRGCQVLAITTGGKLADLSREQGVDLWTFPHSGQPRAAIGYSFGLLLAALFRANLIPDPGAEITDAVRAMRQQQHNLAPEVPTVKNPAKRAAGQLVGRWVCILGADFLAPVARRWKCQINELAKTWAQFGAIPEANHNTLAGINNPEEELLKAMALFLQAGHNHPRNQRRIELTRKNFMVEGLATDLVSAEGDSRLAQMWTLIHFGDFMAYYLAMLYDEDPTPVAAIENLKREL